MCQTKNMGNVPSNSKPSASDFDLVRSAGLEDVFSLQIPDDSKLGDQQVMCSYCCEMHSSVEGCPYRGRRNDNEQKEEVKAEAPLGLDDLTLLEGVTDNVPLRRLALSLCAQQLLSLTSGDDSLSTSSSSSDGSGKPSANKQDSKSSSSGATANESAAAFAAQLQKWGKVLLHVHSAMVRVRSLCFTKSSVAEEDSKKETSKTSSKSDKSSSGSKQAEKKGSTTSSSKSEVLIPKIDPFRLNLDLLRSVLLGVSAPSASSSSSSDTNIAFGTPESAIPLLGMVLNTLDAWLTDASPLSLRSIASNEGSRPILVLICQFLAWAACLDSSSSSALESWKSRALAHLLKLVVQSGSLQVALHACATLMNPSAQVSPASELDLSTILQPLKELRPDQQINSFLDEQSVDFLGFYEYLYPNVNRAALAEEAAEAQKKAAKLQERNQRGHRYGRRNRRGGFDDEDQEDVPDESDSIASQQEARRKKRSSSACDGSYLYFHSTDGLAKVGSGYNGTRRGHTYTHNLVFHAREVGSLLVCAPGRLLFRSSLHKDFAYVIDAETLQDIGTVAIPTSMSAPLSVFTGTAPHMWCVRMRMSNHHDQQPDSKDEHSASIQAPEEIYEAINFEVNFQVASIVSSPSISDLPVIGELNAIKSVRLSGWTDLESNRHNFACYFCHRLGLTDMMIYCNTCQMNGFSGSSWCADCQAKGMCPPSHDSVHACTIQVPSPYSRAWLPWNVPDIEGGSLPAPRSAHTMSAIGSKMYVFGGFGGQVILYEGGGEQESQGESLFNDLHCYDTETSSWTQLDAEGDAPSARCGHSAIVIQLPATSLSGDASSQAAASAASASESVTNAGILIFGGGKNERGADPVGDLFVYDVDNNRWFKPNILGSAPSPRVFCSSALSDDGKSVYFFGGRAGPKSFSDLFRLDIATWTWHSLSTTCASNTKLPSLFGSILAVVPGKDRLLSLAGSRNSFDNCICDIYSLDLKRLIWTRAGSLPIQSTCDAYQVVESKIYLFSSYYNMSSGVFDMTTMTLQTCSVDHSDHGKLRSLYSSGCMIGSTMYTFGGSSDVPPGARHGNGEFHASNKFTALDVAAAASVPLTSAALKQGSFYTDGQTLCVILPKAVPPNVLSRDKPITRQFNLVDGSFLGDIECSHNISNASSCYDSIRNVVYLYDREHHVIKQWCNTSPPIKEDVDEIKEQKATSLVSMLVGHCERFALAHLIGPDEPVRLPSGKLTFETLCVEANDETFRLFHRLLKMVSSQPEFSYLLLPMLRLLYVNLRRWSWSLTQSATSKSKSSNSDSKVTFHKSESEMATIKNEILDMCTKTWTSNAKTELRLVAIDSILAGLNFFFESSASRGEWLKEALDWLLPSALTTSTVPNGAAALASSSNLTSTSDSLLLLGRLAKRLAVDPAASFLLQPPCETESSVTMPLQSIFCDGGGNSTNRASTSSVVLRDDSSVYTTGKYRNVNFLFAHSSTPPPTNSTVAALSAVSPTVKLYPTSIIVRAPVAGYDSPVGFGLIFILDSATDIEATSMYDDWTPEQAEELFSLRLGSRNGRVLPGEPIASFHIESNTADFSATNLSAQVRLPRDENGQLFGGRFIAVKCISPVSGFNNGSNLDIEYIGVRGFCSDLEEDSSGSSAVQTAALLLGSENEQNGTHIMSALLDVSTQATVTALTESSDSDSSSSAAATAKLCLELLSVFQGSLLSRFATLQGANESPVRLLLNFVQNMWSQLPRLNEAIANCQLPIARQAELLRESFVGRLLPSALVTLQSCPNDLTLFRRLLPLLPNLLASLEQFSSACQLDAFEAEIAASQRRREQALKAAESSMDDSAASAALNMLRSAEVRLTSQEASIIGQHISGDSNEDSSAWTCSLCSTVLCPSDEDLWDHDNQDDDEQDENEEEPNDESNQDESQSENSDNEDSGQLDSTPTPTIWRQCFLRHLSQNHSELMTDSSADHSKKSYEKAEIQSHWLLDLLQTVASFGGKCAGYLIRSIPVTVEEGKYDTWMSSRLFRNGLESTHSSSEPDSLKSSPWSNLDCLLDSSEDIPSSSLLLSEPSSSAGISANERDFLMDIIELRINSVGSILGRLFIRNRMQPDSVMLKMHPSLAEASRCSLAAALKHMGLISIAQQFAASLEAKFAGSDKLDARAFFVESHDIPSELMPVWVEVGKLRDYIQKVRQSLIAAGIVENVPSLQIDDEKDASSESRSSASTGSTSFSSSAAILDLYQMLSQKIITKARFAVQQLESYTPSVAATGGRLVRQWSSAAVSSSPTTLKRTPSFEIGDLSSPPSGTPTLHRAASSASAPAAKRPWDPLSALMMFFKSDSQVEPNAIDERELERRMVDEFKKTLQEIAFSSPSTSSPSATSPAAPLPSASAGSASQIMDLAMLRQFMLARRLRLGSRRVGLGFIRKLLLACPRLTVQSELLRALPAALRDSSTLPVSALAKPSASSSSGSDSLSGPSASAATTAASAQVVNYHYAGFCGGVGWKLRSGLQFEFQQLWTLLVGHRSLGSARQGILSTALRVAHRELVSMSLACLGLKYTRDDHQFLFDIGLIDMLLPLMGVSSSSATSGVEVSPDILSPTLQKTAWTCFRLIAFSAFQAEELVSGELSALQQELLKFLLEILRQSSTKLTSIDQSAEHASACISALRLLLVISSDHSSVHSFLVDENAVTLLMSLLQFGTPRIQRLAVRGLRKLLPSRGPNASEYPPSLMQTLLGYLGSLLCQIDAPQVSSIPEATGSFPYAVSSSDSGSMSSTSATAAYALAAEICIMIRDLMGVSQIWSSAIGAWIQSTLPQLRICMDQAQTIGLDIHDKCLHEINAALCIMGGHRELLRPGVPIEVCSATQRKKIRRATLLDYDPVSCTATVTYSSTSSSIKKPEQLPVQSLATPLQEVAFDPASLEFNIHDLQPFQVLFDVPIQSSPPSSSSLSSLPSSSSSSLSSSSSAPSVVSLLQVQLRARALRSLSVLLSSRANAKAFLSEKLALGSSLSALAQLQHGLGAASDTMVLAETETRLQVLTQRCAESNITAADLGPSASEDDLVMVGQNLISLPIPVSELSGSQNDSVNVEEQAKKLPYQPFRNVAVRLPSRMITDNSNLVIDEAGCSVSSTGRLRTNVDRAAAWADIAISDELPSFYFEITVTGGDLMQSPDAVALGFYSVGRGPISGSPGLIPGSFGLNFAGAVHLGSETSAKSMDFFNGGRIQQTAIGLLWNRIAGKVYFTQNGELHDMPSAFSLPAHTVFVPAIGISCPGCRISVNFGQEPFKFNFAACQYVPLELRIADPNSKPVDKKDKKKKKKQQAKARTSSGRGGFSLDDDVGDSSESDGSDEDDDAKEEKEEKEQKEPEVEESKSSDDKSSDKEISSSSASTVEDEESESSFVSAEAHEAMLMKKKLMKQQGGDSITSSSSSSSGSSNSTCSSSEAGTSNEESQSAEAASSASAAASSGDDDTSQPSGIRVSSSNADDDSDVDDDDMENDADLDFPEEADDDAPTEDNFDEDDWDPYGGYQSRPKPKKEPETVTKKVPLSLDDCTIGVILAIEKRVSGSSGVRWHREFDSWIGRTGVVAAPVDRSRRAVLLRLHDFDGGRILQHWFPLAALSRSIGFVNVQWMRAIPVLRGTRTELFEAAKLESSLSLLYARQSLLVLLNQWASLSDDTLPLPLSVLGGASQLLQVFRRIVLDDTASSSSSSESSFGVDIFAEQSEANSSEPTDIIRRFLMYVLKSNDPDQAKVVAAEMIKLALEALADCKSSSASKTATSTVLGASSSAKIAANMIPNPKNPFDGEWRAALASTAEQSCRFASFLLDVLCRVACPPSQRIMGSDVSSSTSSHDQTQVASSAVFTGSVFNAIASVMALPANSTFQACTNIYQMLHPLICIMLTQINRFQVHNQAELPNLSQLSFVTINMRKRYESEVPSSSSKEKKDDEKGSTAPAVGSLISLPDDVDSVNPAQISRFTQSLTNISVLLNQATFELASMKESTSTSLSTASSSSASSSSASSADDLNAGPNIDQMPWFDLVRLNAELMQGLLNGQGLPAWLVRAAWLSTYSEERSVTVESEHPYERDQAQTEMRFENAEYLEVRIDSKSRTDSSDILKFGGGVDGMDELGRVTGDSVSLSNSDSSDDDTSHTFRVSGERLWYRFDQAIAPAHQNVLCGNCDFPISGRRFVCSQCPNFSLCSACEAHLDDSHNHGDGDMSGGSGGNAGGIHDPRHVFVQVLRPLPGDSKFPRLLTQSLYPSQSSAESNKPVHPDTKCVTCGCGPIIGTRFRCMVCPNMDFCSTCESSHQRSHFLMKIRRPVPAANLRMLQNVNMRSLYDSINSGGQYFGYKFVVTPFYSAERQKQLLNENRDHIESAVNHLLFGMPLSESNRISTQLVELTNQECEKLVPEEKDKSDPYQQYNYYGGFRGRGRGRGGHRHIRRSSRRRAPVSSSSGNSEDDQQLLPLHTPVNAILRNESQLQGYTLLQPEGVDNLKLRLAVLRRLNKCLIRILPLIDWSQVRHDWSLSCIFGQLRGLVFSDLKNRLWRAAIDRTSESQFNRRGKSITLDNLRAAQAPIEFEQKADTMDVIDMTMFGQMFSQLRSSRSSTFRCSNQPYNVRYSGEGGIDAGGLFRDSLTAICQELQSPYVPLFIPCPNARHGVGVTLDKYLPNPTCPDACLPMFTFLGKLMGVAIRTRTYLELDLPSLVWKPLVGQTLDASDVSAVDQILDTAMKRLLDDDSLAEKGVDSENFVDLYDMNFTYSSSDERVVELLPNGAEIPVTWERRAEFARLVREMRLRESIRQIQAIRQGLISVIPSRYLSLLTWKELELEVCGSPEIDIELLKQHTRYNSCSVTDSHIQNFWKVLTDFSQPERALFLRFCWGRSRLPPASKFKNTMIVDSSPRFSADRLPTSHTCSFVLELPRYPTREVLREKLLKAISLCATIDNA